jgi:hypothetical protein
MHSIQKSKTTIQRAPTMKGIDDKIIEAEVRLKQLKAQRSAIEARKTQALTRGQRASDTRRKILVGAWVLGEMDKDPAFALKIMSALGRYLEREDDRALFGLPPNAPPRERCDVNQCPSIHFHDKK